MFHDPTQMMYIHIKMRIFGKILKNQDMLNILIKMVIVVLRLIQNLELVAVGQEGIHKKALLLKQMTIMAIHG